MLGALRFAGLAHIHGLEVIFVDREKTVTTLCFMEMPAASVRYLPAEGDGVLGWNSTAITIS